MRHARHDDTIQVRQYCLEGFWRRRRGGGQLRDDFPRFDRRLDRVLATGESFAVIRNPLHECVARVPKLFWRHGASLRLPARIIPEGLLSSGPGS